VNDVYVDDEKKKLEDKRDLLDYDEEIRRKADEEIEDMELRDSVLRENLYFLHDKKLVTYILEGVLKKNVTTT